MPDFNEMDNQRFEIDIHLQPLKRIFLNVSSMYCLSVGDRTTSWLSFKSY